MAEKIIALAGNPNVGKSTLFNALTGLKQHTGNWTGKTVSSAFGKYTYSNEEYTLVDLPGTYSLLVSSKEEAQARNFLLENRLDAVVVVVDAT
ncbi:MAG: FeoB small GTPase domain-containing protein, partial [Oscillospiraceae bacterium]|nr:FeoB small GTPase domain-containing protein [Oscillospiraceae bacterium]